MRCASWRRVWHCLRYPSAAYSIGLGIRPGGKSYMAVLLALFSSLSWGTADFLGGLASRRVGSLRVLSVSYPTGGVLITVLAVLFIPGVLSSDAVLVGVASGAVGAVGMGLLYAALSRGQMGIVSPITAVLSGAVQVV